MIYLSYNNWFYLISIGLQISGSFLLAYVAFTRTFKDVSNLVVSKDLIVDNINDIQFPSIIRVLCEIHLARAGFLLLMLGYILAFLGDSNITKITKEVQILVTIAFSVAISAIIIVIIKIHSRREYPKAEKYVKENLPKGTIIRKRTNNISNKND